MNYFVFLCCLVLPTILSAQDEMNTQVVQVWAQGQWQWNGSYYIWVPAHWMQAPAPQVVEWVVFVDQPAPTSSYYPTISYSPSRASVSVGVFSPFLFFSPFRGSYSHHSSSQHSSYRHR